MAAIKEHDMSLEITPTTLELTQTQGDDKTSFSVFTSERGTAIFLKHQVSDAILPIQNSIFLDDEQTKILIEFLTKGG